MESKQFMLVIDAQPQYLPTSINVNVCPNTNNMLKTLLGDFTIRDYKSLFFLLMDYVGSDNFFNLTNKKESFFPEFCKIYTRCDCNILIELFGTMKKYKKLRLIGTCHHIYKNFQGRNLNFINEIWKMLYLLSEELTDRDLEILKQIVPNNFKDLIITAEDWFCWALNDGKFSKSNFSKLKVIFDNYPECLRIIKKYEVQLEFYTVKTPTPYRNCGLAVIINFDTFDEKSNLSKREGSNIDVDCLTLLWKNFGFKTDVLKNLSYQDTLKELEYYATLDYTNYDLFVCCILSHGMPNSVYSSDGIPIPIPDLMAPITNSPNLNQKPKLFFIQACQGTVIHQGIGKPMYDLPTCKPNAPVTYAINKTPCDLQLPPITCDTLRVTSTIEGFVSFRNLKTGSWFIQALYDTMMKIGDKCSILDVITEVNKEVRKCSVQLNNSFGSDESKKPLMAQQIVNCTHTFEKILILKKCIN